MSHPIPSGGSRLVAAGRGWLVLSTCLSLGACSVDRADSPVPGPAVVRQTANGGASLTLTLDRDALTIVETLALQFEVETGETDTVEFPASGNGFGEFAVILDEPAGERLLGNSRVVRTHEYVLQPFLPGEYEIPSLTVVVNGTSELTTDPIPIAVDSVLEDPQDSELRDISEPVDVPVPWWWWVAAAIGIAAGVAALAWWRRRRLTARSAPKPVPPHESALAALDALLAAGLPAPEALKDFYLTLSDIVRRYVEERFGLRAPEQTTEEFLVAMAAEPVIRTEHQRLLRDFLEQADLVKFAKLVPGREEIEGAVEAARRFVRQTVPEELIAPENRRR